MDEHIIHKPIIDKIMAKLRLRMFKLNPRNSGQHICHSPYTKQDLEMFKKFNIDYCSGYCGEECKYLQNDYPEFDVIAFLADLTVDKSGDNKLTNGDWKDKRIIILSDWIKGDRTVIVGK